ncbi:DUF4175 family protein [bacterium]|nr:MAG: DUF4175 family protein [bacterium]
MTPSIDGRLRAWRRQRLAALWAPGFARLAAAAAAGVLAAAVLDRLFGLPLALRVGAFWAGAAALAGAAGLWLGRPLKELEAGRVLDAAAERWPECRGLLRSAWELARQEPPPGTSGALAERHIAAAETAARALPEDRLFAPRVPSALKGRLAGLACLWAAGLPLVGGPAGVARVLTPWREVPLESDLDVAPGDARVLWASRAELAAHWKAGAVGGALTLETRGADGDWDAVSWERAEGGGGSFKTGPLTEPLDYRILSRGRRSRAFRVTPVPAPRFTGLTARIQRPGGEPREVALDGVSELAALRGSWVAVRGVPDRPLERAWLEAAGLGGPAPMRPVDGGAWEAGFPLRQDGVLKVVAEAGGTREADPPSWQLRALEDRPPEASLLSPAFPVETSRRERLPVTYEVRDDHALSGAFLVYRADGGPERSLPLPGLRPGASSHLGEHAWDLSGFPDGAKVEFRVRAVDDARPERQSALSAPGYVVLTDFDAAHAEMERKWLGAEGRLAVLALAEKRMRESLAEAAALPAAEREARAGALAEQDRALSAEWEKSAAGLNELAAAMENDPYANPGMAESSRALSSAVEQLRREDLPAARQAHKAGDLPKAAERHGELADKVKRAGELLSGGREMQAMQDLWGDAQKMESAGSDLAGALSEAAKRGKPTPEEKKRLEAAMQALREQMDAMAKLIAGLPKPAEQSPAERRRKVYTVPLNDAAGTMDALEAAMARGDYAEAARLAEELTQKLRAVQGAVGKAARDMAESADQSPAKRLGELEQAWKEAAARQEAALESVAAVDEARLADKTKAQQDLLERLAAEQRKAVAEGERLGRWLPPGPLPDMRASLAELEARRIKEAPERMTRAAERLEAQARALTPKDGEPTQPAKDLAALAQTQRDAAQALKDGARDAPMSEERLGATMAAGAVQRRASGKAGELEPMVEGLEHDYGLDLNKASSELSEARKAQGEAEEALGRRDTRGARGAQERALEHLKRGAEEAGKGRERAQANAQRSSQPFGQKRGTSRPLGKGGRTGSDTGFVPMPGVQEYQPPRVIRGEVEKSLLERRPPAFDKAVDDYLKRLSQ